MPVLRAFLANLVFFINLVVWMLVCLPAFLMPRRFLLVCMKGWAATSVWLLKNVVGLGFELRGRENLPDGGYLIASKHQSTFETFALIPLLPDPAYIMKRELLFVPLFGWFAAKAKMIPVNRGKRSKALRDMTEAARGAIDDGRQIIIFPEGTRKAPGAEPNYKYGIAHLYRTLNAPCVPVALNSGLFWPRRELRRHAGTIVVSILPPIEPGLDAEAFQDRLQTMIEAETAKLIDEALAAPHPPPAPVGWERTSPTA